MGGHAACGDRGWAGGRPDSRRAAGRRPGVHRPVRPCLHRQTTDVLRFKMRCVPNHFGRVLIAFICSQISTA